MEIGFDDGGMLNKRKFIEPPPPEELDRPIQMFVSLIKVTEACYGTEFRITLEVSKSLVEYPEIRTTYHHPNKFKMLLGAGSPFWGVPGPTYTVWPRNTLRTTSPKK